MTEPTSHCGTCTMCCRSLGVEELNKPAWTRCTHSRPGTAHGCAIYADRPPSCQSYECAWHQTQQVTHPWPPELRPDRCGVIFDGGARDGQLVARVALGAERKLNSPEVQAIFQGAWEKNIPVFTMIGPHKRRLTGVRK
jgi:hypothetical protein